MRYNKFADTSKIVYISFVVDKDIQPYRKIWTENKKRKKKNR